MLSTPDPFFFATGWSAGSLIRLYGLGKEAKEDILQWVLLSGLVMTAGLGAIVYGFMLWHGILNEADKGSIDALDQTFMARVGVTMMFGSLLSSVSELRQS